MTRKPFLMCLLLSIMAVSTVGAIPPAGAELTAFTPQNVRFLEIASGLTQPLFVTNASDGSGRLFIIQRTGQILIHRDGKLLQTPFLNIQSIVDAAESEQGLLGLAFHPQYETNGRFYTVHTDRSNAIVLSLFTRSSTNPDQADPNSQVTLLSIPKRFTNHNGGTLAFGPDGYLYWSTGDGGGGGDPDNNAQNVGSLLGKILRLDVSFPASYSIPPGNPFYNTPASSIRKEIWAYGLRNPWRFSFDRATGDLYIGDVGQNKREEINFQSMSSSGGENYGWRIMEGSLCYDPATGCDKSGKVLPVAEYDHAAGCSVTAGSVYRGTLYPQMQGYYFYGDFCSGIVYAINRNAQNNWTPIVIADTPYLLSSFGEDEQGELYLTDYSAGKVYQVFYMRPPALAILTSPSGTVTNAQPTFSWPVVSSSDQGDAATWYYLWINGPAGNLFNQWYEASDICSGGTCSVPSPITLSGGKHTWWIQTWNNAGSGPWSDGMDFRLPLAPLPAQAILVSPAGSVTNTTPLYTWEEVPDSTWYYLWVNGPSGNVIKQWYTSKQANCNGTTCSIQADKTLSAGSHTWWIMTYNSAGDGPWSNGMSFVVTAPDPPGKATLNSPAGSIATKTPTYTWSEVPGSTWYYLWVNGPSGNVIKQWYTSEQASCNDATCSVTPTIALGSGAHTWWIMAYGAAGDGPWSDGMNFTTP